MDKKHFCIKLFTGLSITPSGACAPCCLFERMISDDNGEVYKIWKDDQGDIFNSKFMQDIRRKTLNDEPIDACRQCYQMESAGGTSLRIQSNSEEPVPLKFLKYDDTQIPRTLDLKLNNKCNLRCRMCQPRDSNLIYDEFRKISMTDASFENYTNTHMTDPDLRMPLDEIPEWSSTSQFEEIFSDLLPGLRKISIVGGEPLLLDETYQLLEKAVESGHSKKIRIVLTTNLTQVRTDKLKKIMMGFEKVLINISLDAVGPELNYIRYPSNFEHIMKNFRLIASWDLPNVIYCFSPTVQVYNVLYLDKIYDFVESILEENSKFTWSPVHLTYVEHPVHLNVRILPQTLRDEAVAKLEAMKLRTPLLQKYVLVKGNLNQLIHILKHESFTHYDYVPEFLNYSETLDKSRGQNGPTSLPELFKFFEGMKSAPPIESYHRTRERGWESVKAGKLEKAIEFFQVTAKLSRNPDLDFREIAWILRDLGRETEALAMYEKAFALNPEDPYILKGLVYGYVNAGNNPKVRSILEKAINANPEDKDLAQLSAQMEIK